MAILYVDDTGGGDYTTLKGATDAQTAGEDIYALNTHAETPTTIQVYILADGVNVYSANSSDEYTRGAEVDGSGTDAVDCNFSGVGSFNGFDFLFGDDLNLVTNDSKLFMNDCSFTGVGVGSVIISSALTCSARFNSCDFNFTHTSAATDLISVADTTFEFKNCTISSATTSSTRRLVDISSGDICNIKFENTDLSGFLSTGALIDNGNVTTGTQIVTFINCILPPDITSLLSSSSHSIDTDLRVELIGCTKPNYSGADDNDSLWYYEKHMSGQGDIVADDDNYLTTTYDGTNKYSLLFSTATPSKGMPFTHRLAEIPKSNLTTSKDVTVYFSCADILYKQDVYITVGYYDNDDNVLGVIETSLPANILGSTTLDTYSGSATWTGGGTNKYECLVVIPASSNLNDCNLKVDINMTVSSKDIWVEPAPIIR